MGGPVGSTLPNIFFFYFLFHLTTFRMKNWQSQAENCLAKQMQWLFRYSDSQRHQLSEYNSCIFNQSLFCSVHSVYGQLFSTNDTSCFLALKERHFAGSLGFTQLISHQSQQVWAPPSRWSAGSVASGLDEEPCACDNTRGLGEAGKERAEKKRKRCYFFCFTTKPKPQLFLPSSHSLPHLDVVQVY